MAGLSDILTTAQNIASNINELIKGYVSVQGAQNLANIKSATVVKAAPGRICVVSVTTAGSATGLIYDATAVAGAASQLYPVFVIPMAVGITVLNFPMNYGIVCAPGSGQAVSISYS